MRANEFLSELLDRPLPIKWDEEPGYVRAYFDVNGKEGMVKFYYEAFVWTIDFFIDGRHDITGQGDELVIFSTVSKAILEFISKHNPNLIAFSAKEPSRAKLYKRMSQRLTGYTIDPELSKQAGFGLKKIKTNNLPENFADGKHPGRKGLAKRSGVNTKASISSLRNTAKHSSGEKQRMSHWLANMKAGRAKKK